jgi:hypothetical protein
MYVQSPELDRGVTDGIQVEELWDSMCQSTIALVNKSLPTIDNDDRLLKIKGVIALFVQTMGVSVVQFPPQVNQRWSRILTGDNRAGAILLIVLTSCYLLSSTNTLSCSSRGSARISRR